MKQELKITVYSTPNCVQCRTTKQMLDRAGVPFDSIDLTQHPELADQFKQDGLSSAPIIIATSEGGTTKWSGFRYSKIQQLIDIYHELNREG